MRLLYIHGNRIDSEKANLIQVVHMCQAFAHCGIDVRLAIAEPRDRSKRPDAIAASILGETPGFQILTYRKLTFLGRMDMLGAWFGVRALLREVSADLCFVRDPLTLRLAINAGRPTVFEAHAATYQKEFRWLNRLWEQSLVANARQPNLIKFIATSHALGEFWEARGVPQSKMTILHNGFSARLFTPATTQKDARRELNLPLDKKIVVYAGQLGADRGIERIMRLAQNTPTVDYVVIGGPETRRIVLAERAAALGARNVSWIGHVPNAAVSTYLFAADVLLMLWTWAVPTIKICSPLKVFEYMASGRLIVGEAFPTIKEVLEDGKTAYLAQPDSFEELSMKLGEALSQSYPAAMATDARTLAFAEYSLKARAGKILQSLDGLF